MTPLAMLGAMGEALGGPRWVHGPGGNVSVKAAGELWIKASGTRLADVASPSNHVRVSLDRAKAALEGDASADEELFSARPRPSLETYFHALGGPVVAHTHALGALLYACSDDPYERKIADEIASIPYVTPGRGIAIAIRDVFAPGVELVVLRSHGVVAYTDDVERAIAVTWAFDDRMLGERARGAAPIQEVVDAYLAAPAHSIGEAGVRSLPSRKMRFDPARFLFPDAVVCATPIAVDRIDDDVARAAFSRMGRACILVDPSGARLAVAKSETALRQTCEVAAAHDWLEDALVRAGNIRYLSEDEPARIVGLPSEQYRIKLKQ